MQGKKLNFARLFILSLVLSFSACTSEKSESTENQVKVEVSQKVEDPSNPKQKEMRSTMKYSVPTPSELFAIIKNHEGPIETSFLHDADLHAQYVAKQDQALVFGVYVADLAYSSAFSDNTKSVKYFSTLGKIGEELGIAAAFDEVLDGGTYDQFENSDSVGIISSEAFYNAYAYLEENKRGDILALIVAGGFVESLHIVTNMVGDYDAGNPLIDRVSDQKYTIDNLLGFMDKYKENSEVWQVMEKLNELKQLFEGIAMEESADEVGTEDVDGATMILGGGELKIDATSFEKIKAKTSELRSSFVSVV